MNALDALQRVLKAAGRRVRDWVSWVHERLSHEPGYTEALAITAIAVAELLVSSDRIRRVIVGAAHGVLLLIRNKVHHRDADDLEPVWA